jgi:hypothetical protein
VVTPHFGFVFLLTSDFGHPIDVRKSNPDANLGRTDFAIRMIDTPFNSGAG